MWNITRYDVPSSCQLCCLFPAHCTPSLDAPLHTFQATSFFHSREVRTSSPSSTHTQAPYQPHFTQLTQPHSLTNPLTKWLYWFALPTLINLYCQLTCMVSTNLTEQISRRFQEGFEEKSRTCLRCFCMLHNVLNLLVFLNIEQKQDMHSMGVWKR